MRHSTGYRRSICHRERKSTPLAMKERLSIYIHNFFLTELIEWVKLVQTLCTGKDVNTCNVWPVTLTFLQLTIPEFSNAPLTLCDPT